MSDYYDFTNFHKDKLKKLKITFPVAYLRNVMSAAFQMFLPNNLLSDIKNTPITLYNRLFGSSNSRQIYNVLVLVADLESNIGAACIELLNNEVPEILKHFNYRQNFPFLDDNLFFDDFLDGSFESHSEPLFNYQPIDNSDIQNESTILDANLNNEDRIDVEINPDYLMQISLTSDLSAADSSLNQISKNIHIDNLDLLDPFYIANTDWVSPDTSNFTEVSTSENSFETADKENAYYEYEEDESIDDDLENDRQLMPKPIKREINQLRMLGVPFDYKIITQSSHEEFKILRSNPGLTKSQIASMINARRRYINRRAATRCRTQKVQQKDKLKIELNKLQDQLTRTRITLTKAYQERNQMKDSYRELQTNLMSRLQSPNGVTLSLKRWSTEISDNRSLYLRETTLRS